MAVIPKKGYCTWEYYNGDWYLVASGCQDGFGCYDNHNPTQISVKASPWDSSAKVTSVSDGVFQAKRKLLKDRLKTLADAYSLKGKTAPFEVTIEEDSAAVTGRGQRFHIPCVLKPGEDKDKTLKELEPS